MGGGLLGSLVVGWVERGVDSNSELRHDNFHETTSVQFCIQMTFAPFRSGRIFEAIPLHTQF